MQQAPSRLNRLMKEEVLFHPLFKIEGCFVARAFFAIL